MWGSEIFLQIAHQIVFLSDTRQTINNSLSKLSNLVYITCDSEESVDGLISCLLEVSVFMNFSQKSTRSRNTHFFSEHAEAVEQRILSSHLLSRMKIEHYFALLLKDKGSKIKRNTYRVSQKTL